MAAHSSILAWRIPWTEELGGLQSMGSQRVGHDLATKQQITMLKISRHYYKFSRNKKIFRSTMNSCMPINCII